MQFVHSKLYFSTSLCAIHLFGWTQNVILKRSAPLRNDLGRSFSNKWKFNDDLESDLENGLESGLKSDLERSRLLLFLEASKNRKKLLFLIWEIHHCESVRITVRITVSIVVSITVSIDLTSYLHADEHDRECRTSLPNIMMNIEPSIRSVRSSPQIDTV